MDHHNCSNHDCSSHAGIGGVFQNMEELDFQRGPWSAASLGDYDAIKSYVERGKDPSVKDSYGYTPLVSWNR